MDRPSPSALIQYFKDISVFPGGSDGKESAYNVGDSSWIPGLGRAPEEGNSSLPGKFHGQRSLAGYSPWGCRVRHDGVAHIQLSSGLHCF